GSGDVIKGDATAVGSISGSGSVSGTVTQGAPPFPSPPTPPCPTGGYTPAAYVPSGAGISYNAGTGVLIVSGGHNLTLTAPPTKYYFSSVTTSGASTIPSNGGGRQRQVWVDDQRE